MPPRRVKVALSVFVFPAPRSTVIAPLAFTDGTLNEYALGGPMCGFPSLLKRMRSNAFVSVAVIAYILYYGDDLGDRATIPEEIKQARWIVKERQEMLAEAKRECDRILGEAREQAVREASQTEIVKLAERQAGEIVDDARRQARETRLEMEDWADSILSTLEVNLDKFLSAVKRGRERLHERSQETVVAGVAAGGLESSDDEQPY